MRRIAFDTGELLLTRVPIIPTSMILETEPKSVPSLADPEKIVKWWTENRRYMMESEVATMKYIKSRTKIPVPVVFDYMTVLENNPVRLPFMLMQCIRGNMLFDIGGPDVLTDEQKTIVREAIASTQVRVFYNQTIPFLTEIL